MNNRWNSYFDIHWITLDYKQTQKKFVWGKFISNFSNLMEDLMEVLENFCNEYWVKTISEYQFILSLQRY